MGHVQFLEGLNSSTCYCLLPQNSMIVGYSYTCSASLSVKYHHVVAVQRGLWQSEKGGHSQGLLGGL